MLRGTYANPMNTKVIEFGLQEDEAWVMCACVHVFECVYMRVQTRARILQEDKAQTTQHK